MPECTYCSAVVKNLRSAQVMNLRYQGGDIEVVTVVAAPGNPRTGLLLNGKINQAPSDTYSGESKTHSEPGKQGGLVDAAVRWDGQKWVMAEAKVRL